MSGYLRPLRRASQSPHPYPRYRAMAQKNTTSTISVMHHLYHGGTHHGE